MQTFKLGVKEQLAGTLQSKLSHYQFYYPISNSTCYYWSTTSKTELLLNRRPCSHLDFVVSSFRDQVQGIYNNRSKKVNMTDRSCTNCSFQQEDSVLAPNFRQGSTNDSPWLPVTTLCPNHKKTH